jgi:predicted  nucleic acid-binding Zn-ribbon protein
METAASTPQRSPGEILRSIRKLLAPEGENALTQAKLAKMMSYTEQYIQRMETGHNPVQRKHVRLLSQFKVPPEHAEAYARLLAELQAAVAQSDPDAASIDRLPASAAAPSSANERLQSLEAKVENGHATVEGELARLGSKLEDVKDQHDRSGAVLASIQTEQAHAGSKLAAIQGDVTQSATKLATLQVGQEHAGSRLAAIQGDVTQSALKLASLQAGQDQASTQLSSIRDNLTQSASNLGRIEAKQDQASTQLSAIRGEVTQAGAKMEALQVRQEQSGTELQAVQRKLDKADAKQDTTNAKLDRLTWALGGGGALVGIGLVATVVAFWQQGSLAALAAARLAAAPVPSTVHLNLGPGLVEDALRAQAQAGSQIRYGTIGDGSVPNLGKEPQENWMPNTPLPEQGLPPCHAQEIELNGGCWFELAQKPPCGVSFRKGDKCYIPRHAKRSKPMTDPAPTPGSNPH